MNVGPHGKSADPQLTVASWNCRRATAGSPLWDYLLELDPDVALLQEVGGISSAVRERYACDLVPAVWKHGEPLKFCTGMLVRGEIVGEVELAAPFDWVDDVLARFGGNLVGREVRLAGGQDVRVISVYSPAWTVDHGLPEGLDTSKVRLPTNAGLWLSDILWSCLSRQPPGEDAVWIVGGDLNSSPTFDVRRPLAGNQETLDRMARLGLVECLRSSQGRLTPTYRHTNKSIEHQLDHLFVTRALAARLTYCSVGSHERVFGASLSDHLPIIARFRREASPEETRVEAVAFPPDLRAFVDHERWTFAKTMPEWPHEYIVRERVDDALFERLVVHIRAHGVEGRFYERAITYYEEAGLVYWTMGAPVAETTIVNRCRSEDTYERRLAAGTLP